MWGRLCAVHLLFTRKKQNPVLSDTPAIGMKLLRSINTAAQQVSWLKAKKIFEELITAIRQSGKTLTGASPISYRQVWMN